MDSTYANGIANDGFEHARNFKSEALSLIGCE
jgi:hypothetical protein